MVNIDKIKSLAQERGIKIKYLCAKLGLSETYLSNVKNGRDRMTDERLEIIADLLGTTVAYLNDETDEKLRPIADFTPNSVVLYGSAEKLKEKRLSLDQVKLINLLLDELK